MKIRWPWNRSGRVQTEDQAARRLRLRVANLECRVCALHRVEISEGELRKKIGDDPNWTALSWDYLLDLVEKLYIFDVWFSDAGIVPQLLMETTQANDQGQAPYDEKYFDEDGLELLFADMEPYLREPALDAEHACRVKFFLHFADTTSPLEIGERSYALPATTPLPQRLRDLMPYQPPN